MPFDFLVTGSSGHLGTALMLSLPSLGFKPFVIGILPSATTNRIASITSRESSSSVLRGSQIKHITHAATLHKPHVETETSRDHIIPDGKFIFASTTSTFESALSPAPGATAAWIDEAVVPQPENIYGLLFLVLQLSPFIPERDADEDRRPALADGSLRVLELAYPRVDQSLLMAVCDIVQETSCLHA